jgi:hypothetical protein
MDPDVSRAEFTFRLLALRPLVAELVPAPSGFLNFIQPGEKFLHFVRVLRSDILPLAGILRKVEQLGLGVVAQLIV